MAGGLAETARWFLVTSAELVALFLALSFFVGLLQAWLPAEKVRSLFERRRPVAEYLMGAALGAVTPFCSYSTIPVLAALLEKGVGTGAVMALVVTSMGVSVPEVMLLGGLFRWRLVGALVASVFAVAVGGGGLFALAIG